MGKTVTFTPALAAEYRRLFEKARVSPKWATRMKKAAQIVYRGKDRYEKIAARFDCPWPLIGVIHKMEGDCDFTTHLHNGNPLTDRTYEVPAGRPKKGTPPFSWEESAIDAIEMKGWGDIAKWTLERAMFELERYNGFGYRLYHPTVLTPYLFSGTTLYSRGKYVKDGVFSMDAVSGQTGALGILLALAEIDPSLSLDRMLPFETVEGEDAEPVKDPEVNEDEKTIEFVQQRLKDLGYHEVGNVDGQWGRKTKGAILSFRMENDLELKPEIDDELLTALARAASRPIGESRVTATAKDLKVDKPAVAASGSNKIISGLTAAGAAAYGVVNGVVTNISGAKAYLEPVKDLLGSVPSGVWVAIVCAAAFAIYRNAGKAQNEIVSAYREGSLQ